ncbi:hypothetical protein [Desulfamplus magnetovallimortis]|nr:hypothetical protein [Desulfamplus magnetovallimortis]
MKKATIYFTTILISSFLMLPLIQAETLIFSDDFTSNLSNWSTGTKESLNDAPEIYVEDGRLTWPQGYDYIETNESFTPPIRVEVDLERTQGSVGCKDFSVEFTGTDGIAGVLRLQYGATTKDTINLGSPISITQGGSSGLGVCVNDTTGYTAEMETVSPHQGTVAMTYMDNKVKFSFTNYVGETIETPWKNFEEPGSKKIRIWATAAFRYVDNVRIYSLSDASQGSENCASVNLTDMNIDMPCIMIDGVKYQAKFNFDPSIQGGLYWKLDPSSLKLAQ